ncbi:C40 family peptidase [Bythopirellula goksoeyrii]|uniref:Peptidoglycan endopeptidase RipB n=1 Tax=Bythopirellula goksoeyrii TaxID=1400387 RepID=A0A5B9QLS6_9BACT|nr:C40 family peptidase [Bythopirellula goksoeyrii]QEG35101.1 Peptidoglycan endopeptidase RipB precursor [Bythopirellula goksoeyrii]
MRFVLILILIIFCEGLRAQPATLAPPDSSDRLTRLARQIEPELQGRTDRLSQYVEYFRAQLANDKTLFAFEVAATQGDDGPVVLKGFVEFPETREGLESFLRVLGFDEIENELETLPSAELGEQRFGFVKTAHTLSYDRPKIPHDVVTDCMLGEPLYLLRQEGDYLLVHSQDGYVGYVAAADVHRVGPEAFDRYPTESSVRIVADHQLDSGLMLPLGAVLKRIPDNQDRVMIALPTGEVVEVPSAKCEATELPSDNIEQAIARASQLLGTPYHWGGKTVEGIDCSGLVQVAFASIGLNLPRDSYQQFYLGQLVATRWHRSQLRRGDTLYFVGPHGKIRHTALYLGDDQFLEAEMPRVTISSFNREHENYSPKRDASFVFGKRLW